MDRSIVHDKSELIYDYHRCRVWCERSMPRPSDEQEHSGTWAANGEYFWRAFSNGNDPHRSLYPNIPSEKREWRAVEGSNSLYCFRAGPGVNAPGRFELQCSFLSCFCDACRSGSHHSACEALGTVLPPFYVEMHEKPRGRARPPTRGRQRGRAAAAAAAAATAAAAAARTARTAAAAAAAAPAAAAAAAPAAPAAAAAGAGAAAAATEQAPAGGARPPRRRTAIVAAAAVTATAAAEAAASPVPTPATPGAPGAPDAAPPAGGRKRGPAQQHERPIPKRTRRAGPNDGGADDSSDGSFDGGDDGGSASGSDVCNDDSDDYDDDASDTEHQPGRLACVAFA